MSFMFAHGQTRVRGGVHTPFSSRMRQPSAFPCVVSFALCMEGSNGREGKEE
jgi:hypothetical protein